MTRPVLLVQVGFGSAPDDPVQEWTDITPYVRLVDGLSWNRGRADEQSQAEPGQISVTLNNDDGHFSYGNTDSDYYPNVIPGKILRVSVGWVVGGALIPRFEGPIDGWPIVWAGIAERSRVTITATDRLAWFGTSRPLGDPLLEELGKSATAQQDSYYLGPGPEDE